MAPPPTPQNPQNIHEREQAEYLSERKEDEMDLDSDTESADAATASAAAAAVFSVASPPPRRTFEDRAAQTTESPPICATAPAGEDEAAAVAVAAKKRHRVDEDRALAATPAVASTASTNSSSRLVCLMGIFLHAHPLGASMAYIQSYLESQGCPCRLAQLEAALADHTSLFDSVRSGEGASLHTKWFFRGFSAPPPSSICD